MPSSKNYKRNVKQEYKTMKKRGGLKVQKKRMQDQRAHYKKNGKPGKGQEVGHAGKGAKGPTKSQSRKSNRAEGGRIGNRAGKAAGGRKGMRSRWGKKK